ncbi:MAG: ferredoxin Fer [Haloplanus sp.]
MDAFDVLGIDPDASDAEVDQAYRRRVMETHPDQGGSAREFQRVKTAYERITAIRDGDGEDQEQGRRRPAGSRITYLDYEVVDDHGWTLDDADLFEKAAAADLGPTEYGEFLVEPGETLLEAAENRGFAWPYACRGGACANCAIAVVEGEMTMPADHILPAGMYDRGIRLSCLGGPTTDEMKVVYNVKGLSELDDLRLPPYRFERTRATD